MKAGYVKMAIFCNWGSNNWKTVVDRRVHAARRFYRAMLCKRGLCCHAVSVCSRHGGAKRRSAEGGGCLARGLRPLHRPSLCVVDILRYFRPCRLVWSYRRWLLVKLVNTFVTQYFQWPLMWIVLEIMHIVWDLYEDLVPADKQDTLVHRSCCLQPTTR